MTKVGKTKNVKTASGMTKMFQKEIRITLIGSNKADLQAVAHKIHSLNDPLLLVGNRGRKVTMTHESTDPKCIFNGQVKVERRYPKTGKVAKAKAAAKKGNESM